MVCQIQLVICENYAGRVISHSSVGGQSFLSDCDAIGVDRGHLKDSQNVCLVIGAALFNFYGRCCSAQGVSKVTPLACFVK